jgi:hypothetical protein
MTNTGKMNRNSDRKGVSDMQAQTSIQMTIVRSRMIELQAEAAQSRLASTARAASGGGFRRWLGGRLVAAGAAIARDGLVEGTGEPISRVVGVARPVNPYDDPCIDVRSGLGRAL